MSLNPLETVYPECPYCGERLVCEVDTSVARQQYIEDCHVCCSPIVFTVEVDYESERVWVEASRDDY